MNRRSIIVALSLAGLVLANLSANVGLILFSEERFAGSQWFHEVTIGILLGQLALLAFWIGLGDGKWYVRVVLGIALTLCIAQTIGIAQQLSTHSSRDYEPGSTMVIAFMFIPMLLATSCSGLALRRTRGWRLTWTQVASTPATGQFHVGDVLIAMVVMGGALAAVRFLITIIENFPAQILALSLFALKTAAVVILAMMVAFGRRRHFRSAVLLAIAVVLIGAAFAIPDDYERIQQMRAGATFPLGFDRCVITWAKETAKHEAFVVAAAIGTLANCLALRALGGKLVRPGAAVCFARTETAIE